MVVPLDEDSLSIEGDLLGRWDDLSVRDLPPSAQAVALSATSWQEIAEALIAPASVRAACETFVANLGERLEARWGTRTTKITLARRASL